MCRSPPAGVGVGGAAGAGFVNPLVNTQFQYQDVGVNVDITPRVHPNHEVSLKVKVEVSQVTSEQPIGGIQEPVISQRKIEHEIRLKEGESNVLAGLITRSDTKSINGWPGLSRIPLPRYFFSEDQRQSEVDEVLIILTPHILRMPEWTKSNLKALYAGSETNVQVRRESEMRAPPQQPLAAPQTANVRPPAAPVANAEGPLNAAQAGQSAQLRFEPRSLSLKTGQTATVGVMVDNIKDLFSIPFLLRYDPAVISVEDVRHGGFLQAGDQEIAIVQQVDEEHGHHVGNASAKHCWSEWHGHDPGHCDQSACVPGTSTLSIVEVSARDSQQRPMQLVTGEASVQVNP